MLLENTILHGLTLIEYNITANFLQIKREYLPPPHNNSYPMLFFIWFFNLRYGNRLYNAKFYLQPNERKNLYIPWIFALIVPHSQQNSQGEVAHGPCSGPLRTPVLGTTVPVDYDLELTLWCLVPL